MEPAPATSSLTAAPIGGYFQGGKSKFKQLPFAADGSGRLLVRHRKLRVFPTKAGVAMPAAELEAVCKGLAANQCVQMLNLGELRFALGGDDEENALQPLVQLLVESRNAITSLMLAGNALSFGEGAPNREQLRRLIVDSKLTVLNIGGNMDIDEDLIAEITGWVEESQRRWRFVALGTLDDEDERDAAEQLKDTVRRVCEEAEDRAVAEFFEQKRRSLSPHRLDSPQQPEEPDAPEARPRAPLASVQPHVAQPPSPTTATTAHAAAAAAAAPAAPAAAAARPCDTAAAAPSPATKKRKADEPLRDVLAPPPPSSSAAAAGAQAARSAQQAPAAATEERCKAFLAACTPPRPPPPAPPQLAGRL